MKINKKSLIHVLILYFVTLTVHLFIATRLNILHMSHDEMGVLATAAYAVGEDWSAVVSKFGYYGYGSSVLYIPIFLITNGPILRYKLVASLNSCLMSLIPIIAYRIAVKYCKIQNGTAFAAAFAAGLYPGYLLFSKWVWNETMMCLLPWVIMLILFRLYNEKKKSKQILSSVLLAFTLIYSYAVHGRALAFIAAVFLIIGIILIFQRRLIIEPISFCTGFALFYICDHFVKSYIMNHIWLIGSDSEANNTLGGTMSKLDTFLTADGFSGLIRIALGQLSAASASTYGILIIAAVPTIPLIIKGLKKNMRLDKEEAVSEAHNTWLAMTFAMVFFLAAFSVSILFLGGEGSQAEPRGDYFIYTRYFSNTLGLSIFAAFVFFAEREMNIKTSAITIGVYILVTIPMISLASFINKRSDISNTTILNLLAYMGDNPKSYISHIDFNNLILITSIVFGMSVIGFSGKKIKLLSGMLCLIFVHSYITTANNVLLPNSKKDFRYIQPTLNALYHVDNLESSYNNVYYYNVHQHKPWSSSAMQFALPDYRLTEFDFEIDENTDPQVIFDFISENSIIVSSEDIELDLLSEDIYRLEYESINYGTEYMWVYGEDVKNYIVEHSDISIVND